MTVSQISYDDLVEMLEECARQGMAAGDDPNELDDCAISTWQDLGDMLAKLRPDRWETTRRGVRWIGDR